LSMLWHYSRLERPDRNKHSSLMGPIVSYEEEKVSTRPLYYKT
jgi:hypothetical protein